MTLILKSTYVADPMGLRTCPELLNTSSFQVLWSDSPRALPANFGVGSQTVGRMGETASADWGRKIAQHRLTRLDLVFLLPTHMFGPDSDVETLPSTEDMGWLPQDLVVRNTMVSRLAQTAARRFMYRGGVRQRAGEILEVLGCGSGR